MPVRQSRLVFHRCHDYDTIAIRAAPLPEDAFRTTRGGIGSSNLALDDLQMLAVGGFCDLEPAGMPMAAPGRGGWYDERLLWVAIADDPAARR